MLVPLDETDLIARARDGDDAAFAELLRLNEPALRACAARHGVGDFDDRLQIARITLIDAVRHYQPVAGAAFRTFLCKLAIHALIDDARRATAGIRGGNRKALDVSTALDAAVALDNSFDEDTIEALRRALVQLEPVLAEVIRRRLNGERHDDIAEQIGVARVTSFRLERAGLRRLAKLMGVRLRGGRPPALGKRRRLSHNCPTNV